MTKHRQPNDSEITFARRTSKHFADIGAAMAAAEIHLGQIRATAMRENSSVVYVLRELAAQGRVIDKAAKRIIFQIEYNTIEDDA